MTADRSELWVIAYDTPSHRRRRKYAQLLEGYGVRVQWSVFECELRPEQRLRLQRRLERLIDAQEDSVRFWPILQRGSRQIQHLGRTTPDINWEDRLF